MRQNGKTIRIPKPTVVIDSQEHMGYKFERFTNWFSGTIRKRLPVGDYTLHGMEEEVAVERKTLPGPGQFDHPGPQGFHREVRKTFDIQKEVPGH